MSARQLLLTASLGVVVLSSRPARSQAPAYCPDVAPILQTHCIVCHRAGEIGPMALTSYAEARRSAAAIAAATTKRAMPPWFANPAVGHWANDPSLSSAEIRTLAAWAARGAPPGGGSCPPPANSKSIWNIAPPQAVVTMPRAVSIPARGEVAYTYEIVPTGWRHDRWVQMAEARPSARSHVHHAVIYVRPPGSSWLKGAPVGMPFTAATLGVSRATLWTDSDVLLVYAPGSAPEAWPATRGKLIPAGSDLVFQMHYTTDGHAAADQTQIGLVFNSAPPAEQVLTLQLTNDRFVIPPGVSNFRVEAHGSLPGDATLLSFFPHMHLRGERFEYNLIGPGGKPEPLLDVNWNFFWQRSYVLAKPLPLKAGTILQAVAWYDNSRTNPHNPEPDVAVHWGDQTTDEMMVGFFDVAVPRGVDKWKYFAQRHPQP
ncbi:MAG TPA: hypothetical protein VN709_13250 [Terriglobales bacterium]|nr:hypothetical protein [Terriglobales bacterium]